MNILAAALLILALALPAVARAEPPSDTAKAEIAKISRLVGKWKGSGWIIGPHGRSTSNSEETVESRLDGRAFLIEGFHTDTATGAINHHALAILAWDDARREYRMASALASGRTGSFPGKVEGGRFVWTIAVPNGPTSRFTIFLEDPDKWVEIGEQSRDGQTWTRFFEMNLSRVK